MICDVVYLIPRKLPGVKDYVHQSRLYNVAIMHRGKQTVILNIKPGMEQALCDTLVNDGFKYIGSDKVARFSALVLVRERKQ